MEYRIRNATPADMPGILAVEQSWHPAGRAGADKFASRLARFPQGFYVASIDDGGVEKLIATITSMPLLYDAAHIERFTTWDAVTNNGYLFESPDLSRCNALYVVSGVVDNAHRGSDLFQKGILTLAAVAARMKLRYVVGGAVIPGYKRYCERHGHVEAYDYCGVRIGKHLADPLLALYEGIGFTVPDRRHILASYYPDGASRNYAALVVRDLGANPL